MMPEVLKLISPVIAPVGAVKSELEEERGVDVSAWVKKLHAMGKSLDPAVPGGEKSFSACVDSIIKDGTAWLGKEGKEASKQALKYMQDLVANAKKVKEGLGKLTAKERAEVNKMAREMDAVDAYGESIDLTKTHAEKVLKVSQDFAKSQMAVITKLQQEMESAKTAWTREAKEHGGVVPTGATERVKKVKGLCEAAHKKLVGDFRTLTGMEFWKKAFGPIPTVADSEAKQALMGCKNRLDEVRKIRDEIEDIHPEFPEAAEEAELFLRSLK